MSATRLRMVFHMSKIRLPGLSTVLVLLLGITPGQSFSTPPNAGDHRLDAFDMDIQVSQTERRMSQCSPTQSNHSIVSGVSRRAASATFTLSGAGYEETVSYTESVNLIFCRRPGKMVWVRLAAEKREDGEEGPHLDLDLCNMTGSGTFAPMEARGQPCPGGTTWGIWWHDGPNTVYANTAASSPCVLTLTANGNELQGTFACQGLVNDDGTSRLDVLNGSFRCTMEQEQNGQRDESMQWVS